MKQFFITIAGVFVGLMLFFVALPVILIVMAVGAASGGTPTPARTVLQLDLRETLTDQDPQNPFAALGGGGGLSVMKIVRVLGHARDNDNVRGLVIRLPETGMDPAAAEELRLAIRNFRDPDGDGDADKFVLAHSQGLYQSGAVSSTYMLGAAADEFWMQDGAPFQATGISTEEVFLRGFFDRYGINPDFYQRHEYKNAANPYLHTDYTPEHREATTSWLTSVYVNSLNQAAADRRRNPQQLRATFEAGPYGAAEARQRGLIDQLGHVRAMEEAAERRAGNDAELVEFDTYAADVPLNEPGTGPVIAVVGAEGAIVTGTGEDELFGQSQTIWSDDVAEQIYEAIEDDDVRAIVFRVSSPGGSDVASDQILAAIQAARAAGKPVVVSMGTYAASGGYWISTQANAIVAHPSTLTGSIGVLGGKLSFGEAAGRFGLNLEGVSVGGPFAGAYQAGEPFTEAQRAQFNAWMDRIYAEFVTRVATGRNIPVERVQQIARGRVWTGSQARELRLVDELGGLPQAIARAKALARIDAGTEVRLRWMPGEVSPFEALGQAFGASAASVRTLAAAAWVLGDPRAQAIMDQMAETRLREQGATVLAPRELRSGR